MFNKDFYPTPNNLILKMLSKINIRDYKNILDPSVGKGDILKFIKENKQLYGSKLYGIEIDYNLREIAKKYCDIIGFDFLDFRSYIEIDLILANFPFSDGASHFLKAWEVLDKGDLVCFLNAETIKNPYSEKRKLINKIIEDNNGSVEYIKDGFLDAERKTNVEVALIHIKKTTSRMDSIFDGLQKEFVSIYEELGGEIKHNEIVKGNDETDHLIRFCEITKKEYMNMYLASIKFNYYKNITSKGNDVQFYSKTFKETVKDPNEAIMEINRQYWMQWFKNTDIRSKVTTRVYDDFVKDYANSKLDFNYKNIEVVRKIILGTSGEILKQNIIEVFDLFTKYHPENRINVEGWQHNSAFMIGKTVILPYMIENDWDGNVKCIHYNGKDKCRDIDKVFCNLTGKDYNKIDKLENAVLGDTETEFFKIKMYKKGTLHLIFKDTDLVKQFNLEVCKGKKWLIPKDFKFKVK